MNTHRDKEGGSQSNSRRTAPLNYGELRGQTYLFPARPHLACRRHSAVLICPDWQRTFILEEIHATP